MKDVFTQTRERTAEDIIQRALSSVRTHLGMEVAYLSEMVGGDSVFRAVDAPGLEALIKPGDSRPLNEVYCNHIVAGALPRLIPDTSEFPLATAMPITQQVPIGSHVSIPIRREDGTVYGMFCCLSPRPNPTLNDRDLSIMEMFADLCAEQINGALYQKTKADSVRRQIGDVIERQDFDAVFQPIFPLGSDRPSGFEALCRFRMDPYRRPDLVFAEAAQFGMGVDLELAVLTKALTAFEHAPSDMYLSFNVGPETVLSGRLAETFEGYPLDRILLELTEHAEVSDPVALSDILTPLRDQGLRLAIDDAGAGYSGLQQILQIAPDVLKLDMSLTRNVDTDPARKALAAAMVHFASEQGCLLVAEGIETPAELEVLRQTGVPLGQGWLLGKPAPLETALAAAPAENMIEARSA